MIAAMRSLILLLFTTALCACNMGHHSGTGPLESLELNNSEKWQMSPEMGAMFAESVAYFQDANYSTLDTAGLKSVGSGLHQRMLKIIQACNMRGPAHDQLHVFIMGYMPAISKLADEGTIADAELVDVYLTTYTEYFE